MGCRLAQIEDWGAKTDQSWRTLVMLSRRRVVVELSEGAHAVIYVVGW